ncbi:uncharacterized protein LOC114536728 [Dendronephthya gigantea]|uniref:uncharacterized protein LOC114536728 n=1 Tax=Dendronephthya gigantea TaxID=151771 RepID=UPI00106C4807|nr:uncharacterized protein LOC114536728 [Dendronephthya gigantea]
MADRFAELNEGEIDIILEAAVTRNTKKSTKYGMKIFNDWLYTCPTYSGGYYITEMSTAELNSCLKLFYTSARQIDGSYYKKSSMKSIRAAIDRFLKNPPNNKPFSIIGDPAFNEANSMLDAFVKDLRKTGKIAGVVHKKAITKDQIQLLFDIGELGPADSDDPSQLLRTVWFYLGIYLGRRGRENQRNLKPNMLILRATADGKSYLELNREVAGSIPSTKNHQGGLTDVEDESDGKIFAQPDSKFCPVATIQNYLTHLNPNCDALFQRPNKKNGIIWYCNSPVGESTLGKMLLNMTSRAGIKPPLTNHCIRATSVTALAEAHIQTHYIKSVTGHKSDQSIESYNSRPSINQQEIMSSTLANYIRPETAASQSSSQSKCFHNDSSLQSPVQLKSDGDNHTITLNKQTTIIPSGPTFNFHSCNVQIYN